MRGTSHIRGFSLLEVMVALAILSVSLFVLVNSQTTAYIMTLESQKMTTATMLAKEKMSQAILMVESEGFQEQDIEEEGDFAEGVFGEFESGGLDGQWEGLNDQTFEDFKFAYTVRAVELNLDGDVGGMADQLSGSGYWGEEAEEKVEARGEDQTPGLEDMGVSQDMLSDYLSPYIREIRVVVWWGPKDLDDAEEDGDIIELVTHVVNPSGQVVPAAVSGS
ncbi:MAG: prepilin-type N-terminal cleavage/methylation domain-containing protein [Proteobacteria bacterium]|nr:prepilin-type N-terminal cleavage/methylation domain-containing protein [Pseudomonadota bacterium]MCP4916478.1 prepilin-type N-terminal cleavage/methylation domain-containing protein [Pseudomonadota bacterium]